LPNFDEHQNILTKANLNAIKKNLILDRNKDFSDYSEEKKATSAYTMPSGFFLKL